MRQPHKGSPPIFEFFNGASLAHDSDNDDDDNNSNDTNLHPQRRQQSRDPIQTVEHTETSSRPSVNTASFHQASFNSAESSNEFSSESGDATVTADQERQVLLLMLLAQVCALHDPTPKTFTIHVLELYERGILNRDSISFLFELGLVPSISSSFTQALLEATQSPTSFQDHDHQRQDTTTNKNINAASSTTRNLGEDQQISAMPSPLNEQNDSVTYAACEEIAQELALTTTATTTTKTSTTTTTTTATNVNTATKLAAVLQASNDPLRSAEAYAIRTTLAQYEKLQCHQKSTSSPTTSESFATGESLNSPNAGNDNKDDTTRPWDAKNFPLSLSRYQREFAQIGLLASGSFGKVFHATRKMDACDYAVKKVDFDASGYSEESIQEVVREVECLAKVSDHPNVVRYYNSWLEPSWMTGGQNVEVKSRSRGSSSSASPVRSRRRHQQQQRRLLLHNQLENIGKPDISRDNDFARRKKIQDPSFRSYESSSVFDQFENASIDDSGELSSYGMWQRRRFSFGSDVDSSDQSWESYHEHSVEEIGGTTFDEDDSSSSIRYLRNGRNIGNHSSRQRNNRRNHKEPLKPEYRYQISLFIQMQLCHPATLADWIHERNSKVAEKAYRERVGPALDIFEQICKGLAHVHEKGIIHRDLKPANIFASSDGRVIKIGDFGLSKELRNINKQSPTMTRDSTKSGSDAPERGKSAEATNVHWHNANKGALVTRKHLPTTITRFQKIDTVNHLLTAGIGTRSYAAPEQLTTKSYSTAADIFSLGLIFLELICCFETEHERLHNFQQCRQQKGVQRWLMEDYPEIANIVILCTQPDPLERPTAHAILGMLTARRNVDTSLRAVKQPISPRRLQDEKTVLHNNLLQRSLDEKDQELARYQLELLEKDKLIEDLRLQMNQLKASAKNSQSDTTCLD